MHPQDEFCIKLIQSLIQDYKDSQKHYENYSGRVAIRIIRGLDGNTFRVHQYSFSKEEYDLYKKIMQLPVY